MYHSLSVLCRGLLIILLIIIIIVVTSGLSPLLTILFYSCIFISNKMLIWCEGCVCCCEIWEMVVAMLPGRLEWWWWWWCWGPGRTVKWSLEWWGGCYKRTISHLPPLLSFTVHSLTVPVNSQSNRNRNKKHLETKFCRSSSYSQVFTRWIKVN